MQLMNTPGAFLHFNFYAASAELVNRVPCLCALFQALQPEHSGPAVVLCEVYLLWSVSLSDPLRLPHPCAGQLSDQKLQLRQPVSLSRVSAD